MIAPQELLYMSLAQLRTLAAFLDEQLGEGGEGSDDPAPETYACNEILRSLQGLIVRAQAASRPPGSTARVQIAPEELHLALPEILE